MPCPYVAHKASLEKHMNPTGKADTSHPTKFTVEMFGLSPFTEDNSVEVEMREGASVAELVAALRKKMPAFRGRVIMADQDRLVENYGFYVNGEFVSDEGTVVLKQGDRIVLILLATGG